MAVEPSQTSPHVTPLVGEETRTESDTARTMSVPVSPAGADAAVEIDGYEILGELGRGGMGVVYRARHRTLNRPTAVKMIRGDDDRGLQRFLAEAEAIAAVHDPHVVPVYEFGHAGGRAFLALELCPGGTLADRLRRGPKFSTREAVTLLRKVAGGVAAAHAAGVVHRDLKPGNVLFDAAGAPKVSDFGLAKRVTGADLTATQAVMGSPAYMAPEQARGDSKFVGPQADVWALGVLMYELLAGKRPFAADDTWSLLQKVICDEPAGVRSINREVPADLDTVIKKCLSKGPFERYASAAELAEDLDRWLAGEPVSARPAAWPERTLKWVRRNPLPTALAASLVIGTVASVGFALSARAEAARAKVEEGKKDEALTGLRREKQNVEDKYSVTMSALDAMSDDVVEKSFSRQARPLGPDERAFLGKLMALYDDATKDRGESPAAHLARAKALFRIARMRFALGDLAAAEGDLLAARTAFEGLIAGPDRSRGVRLEYGRTRTLLGTVSANRGKSAQAEAELTAACDIRAAVLGENPKDESVAVSLAACRHDLANFYRDIGNSPAALAAYRDARDLFLKALAGRPADAPLGTGIDELRYQLARVRDAYGCLLHEAGNVAAGDAEASAARAMQEDMLSKSPREPMWRWSLSLIRSNVGIRLGGAGRSADAVPEFLAAIGILRPLVGEYPAVPLYRQALGLAESSLALEYDELKRPDEAGPLHAAACETRRRCVEDSPETALFRGELGQGLTNYAHFLHDRNDAGKATALFHEAWPHLLLVRRAFPNNPFWRSVALSNRTGLFQLAVGSSDYDAASRFADEFVEHGPERFRALFLAAANLNQAADGAAKDPTLEEPGRAAKAEALKAQALRYLRVAGQEGYDKSQNLASPELASLKDRAEFRAAADAIRANAQKAKNGKKGKP